MTKCINGTYTDKYAKISSFDDFTFHKLSLFGKIREDIECAIIIGRPVARNQPASSHLVHGGHGQYKAELGINLPLETLTGYLNKDFT